MLMALCEATAYAGAGITGAIGAVILAVIVACEWRVRRIRRIYDSTLADWRVQQGFVVDDGVVGDGAWPEKRP